MCSYDRLFNLAQRTGDRLIIHDPVEGHDVVVMSIDQYEDILDERDLGQHDYYQNFYNDCNEHSDWGRRDVRGMSEGELLDQINRDIAKWRADKELDEQWERENILDSEMKEEGPFDPFSGVDYHPADWHTAGDVVQNRYGHSADLFDDEKSDFESEDCLFDLDEDENGDEEDWDLKPDFGNTDEIKIDDIPDFDINYEAVGEESITGNLPVPSEGLNEIPFKSENSIEGWQEEPLEEDDESEPVFYEEPV